MPNRTQLVCLHEGQRGRSIDPIFINRLIRRLSPSWLRPHPGNNLVRVIGCGGRAEVIARLPIELRACLQAGGDVSLMVWADLDHDTIDGEELKNRFWSKAQAEGISPDEFSQVVFVFAKDRLENWIEFLLTNQTNEEVEGPRVTDKNAAEAAIRLAKRCQQAVTDPPLPSSLEWSCRNWRKLVEQMKNR
jgi:hypothetical protein